MIPMILNTAAGKQGEKKSGQTNAARRTGLAPENPVLKILAEADRREREAAENAERRQAQNAAPRRVPTFGEITRTARPETATESRRRTKGTVENWMSRLDNDRSLQLTPEDRDLVRSALFVRQQYGGRRQSPTEAARNRGFVDPRDVDDVLSALRSGPGRARVRMEVEGFRAQRDAARRRKEFYRAQGAFLSGMQNPTPVRDPGNLPFTPSAYREALEMGYSVVEGRNGESVPLKAATRLWARAGGGQVASARLEDDERNLRQAQREDGNILPVRGGMSDPGGAQRRQGASRTAWQGVRRVFTEPFRAVGRFAWEAVQPGAQDAIRDTVIEGWQRDLGRNLTRQELSTVYEQMRLLQEGMGQLAAAFATVVPGSLAMSQARAGTAEVASAAQYDELLQSIDDTVNAVPQVGEAFVMWANPNATEEDRRAALIQGSLGLLLGTQAGREGLVRGAAGSVDAVRGIRRFFSGERAPVVRGDEVVAVPAPRADANAPEPAPVVPAETALSREAPIVSDRPEVAPIVNDRPEMTVPRAMDGGGELRMVAPEELKVNPRIQYKSGLVDQENKVTAKFKGIDVYSRNQGGSLVAWERADGTLEIVHGHHRAELAKRAKRFTMDGPGASLVDVERKVPVTVLREADGWTEDAVRQQGAIENLRNGDGSALDAAMVLRELNVPREKLGTIGVSVQGALARDVDGLLGLSDEAIKEIRFGDIGEQVGAGIGSVNGLDTTHQIRAMRAAQAAGKRTFAESQQYGRIYRDSLVEEAGSGGLFGDEMAVMKSTISEQDALQTAVQRSILASWDQLSIGLRVQPMADEVINRELRQELRNQFGAKAGLKWKLDKIFDGFEDIKQLRRELGTQVAAKEITHEQAVKRLQDAVLKATEADVPTLVHGRGIEGASAQDVGRRDAVDSSPRPARGDDPERPVAAPERVPEESVAAPAEPKPARAPRAAKPAQAPEPAAARARSAEVTPIRSSDEFRAALTSRAGLSDAEADAVVAITDARARGWAAMTGGSATPDVWYQSRLAGMADEMQDPSRRVGRGAGAVEFAEDGRAIIYAFESAGVDTVLHELGHVFRRDLPDYEVAVVAKAYGQALPATGRWPVEAEEWFAQAFERYMASGRTTHEGLAAVFEKFRNWLRAVWRSIRQEPKVQVSEDLRGVFDRMLDERGTQPPGSRVPAVRDPSPQSVQDQSVQEVVRLKTGEVRVYGEDARAYRQMDAEYGEQRRRAAAVKDAAVSGLDRRLAERTLSELEDAWNTQKERFVQALAARDADLRVVREMAQDARNPEFRLDDGTDDLTDLFGQGERAAPTWVLKSAQVIESRMPNQMPASSARAFLLNAGVKPDELKWTGLDELLQGDEVVTRELLQAKLAEERVRLVDVELGDRNINVQQMKAMEADAAAVRDWFLSDEGQQWVNAGPTERFLRQYPNGFMGLSVEESWKDAVSNMSDESPVFLGAFLRSELENMGAPEEVVARVQSLYDWREVEGRIRNEGGDTKFKKYTPSGRKDNYRELLLTHDLPTPFTGGHWEGTPNVILHLRTTDLDLGDGRKALVVEEIQSDLHQGRRRGRDYPEAPFAKTWHEVGLKRAIRLAAEEGYDEIRWATGEMQNRMYQRNLHDGVTAITLRQDEFGMIMVGAWKGEEQVFDAVSTYQYLADLIGKDMAKQAEPQLRAGEPVTFKGEGMRLGGNGMRQFYDQILPTAAKKLVRQWGAEVDQVAHVNGDPIWRVKLNDEMRRGAMEDGQLLFQGPMKGDPELNRPLTKKEMADPFALPKDPWMQRASELIKWVATAALGSPISKMRSLGKAGSDARRVGRIMAAETERILNLSAAQSNRLMDMVNVAIRQTYGWLNMPGSVRGKLTELARKANAGRWADFTPEEKTVWAAWTRVNKALAKEAEFRGVWVDRFLGDDGVPEKVVNKKVAWYGPDAQGTLREHMGFVLGVVQTERGPGLRVRSETDFETILPPGTRYSTPTLIEPELFFPRRLKDEVKDALEERQGPLYDELVRHIAGRYKLENRAAVDEFVQSLMSPKEADRRVVTGPAHRLEQARYPFQLPPQYYDDDFVSVVQDHIFHGVRRLVAADHWGQDGYRLAMLMNELPSSMVQGVGEEIEVALGAFGGRNKWLQAQRQIAATDGAWQSLSKLTGFGTAVAQLSQMTVSYAILGEKATAKGWVNLVDGAVRSMVPFLRDNDAAKAFQAIRLSGAIDEGILDYPDLGRPEALMRKATEIGLTVSLVKPFDAMLRYHAAVAGEIAVRDAVAKLKVGENGQVVRNASSRLLEEWFLFRPVDIQRLAETRSLTRQDMLMAYHGGAKTQIRNRLADQPTILNNVPALRVIWRFKQFVYGQTKIVNHLVAEAAQGNVTPLMRFMVVGSAIGVFNTELREHVVAWMEGKEVEKNPEELSDWILANIIRSGLYGGYGEGANFFVGAESESQSINRIERVLTPPLISDGINAFEASAFATKTVGPMREEPVEWAKAAGSEWARNTIVLARRAMNRGEPDRNAIDARREEAARRLRAQGYTESEIRTYLNAVMPRPLPRGANPARANWQRKYERLRSEGYRGEDLEEMMGRRPPMFRGRPEPVGVEPDFADEPTTDIQDLIDQVRN